MSLSSSRSIGAEIRARVRMNADDTESFPRNELIHDVSSNPRRRPTAQCRLFVLKLFSSLFAIATLLILFTHLDMSIKSVTVHIPTRLWPQHLSNSSNTTTVKGVAVAVIEPKKVPKNLPVVDRSILERLEGSRKSLKKKKSGQRTWPPVVTSIPDSVAVQAPLHHQSPSRFLLPSKIAEQESKARNHLAQLIKFAEKLNRTLVLPKVENSRLGACSRWKFEFYYDLEGITADNGAVMDMSVFEGWLRDRRELSTQALYLDYKPNPSVHATSHSDFTISTDPTHRAGLQCLTGGTDLVTTFSPSISVHPKRKNHPPFGNDIIQVFRQDVSVALESEVLVVDWNLRFPLFSPSSAPEIGYSPDLLHLAEQLAPSGPYLMVHWRMESVPLDVFTDCALALVDFLSNILNNPGLGTDVKTVWFASDHPIPISSFDCSASQTVFDESSFAQKSSTFTRLSEKHANALHIVREAFCSGGELEGWAVTDLTEVLFRAGDIPGYNSDMLADPGLLGILDKLVGMRATIFVSGSRTCGRKSSFTKQIMDMRKRENRGRNIVDYFG
ncbi:hypothetical protein E1B28_010902 [Marasmius oreades]|uniref:Proteophosphoglycan 5 n=1 Tax=Marasmius oreades TaxID=181124 RepID=A0A9P7RTQ2_9AGAR|nr:uncharacterized protein E1B28_010902 [Marasmius oreades]KAG7089200.1 hypothetical protein E1B28_010902 [Marasmius oreades]